MGLRETVRRGYDALGDRYARERGEEPRHVGRLLAGLSEPLVLDAGCGPGTPGTDGLEGVVGLDISREQLRLARERSAGARVQGDLAALPFPAGRFDAVVACNSLIHVPVEDHPAVYGEFARVLRPGGRLLVAEGLHPWAGENPDWMGSGVGMAWDIAGERAAARAMAGAGFRLLDRWVAGDDTADDGVTPYLLARLHTDR